MSNPVDVRRYLKYSHLPLVIYGAAGTAAKLRNNCFNFGSMSIEAVCDNDPDKQGRMFYNHVIMSPEAVLRKYPDANILIAVMDVYVAEVYSRLRALGVREDRIFKWTQVTDYSSFPLQEFSVCPYRDLYRFGNCLGDDASWDLFRLRYRHWLMGDRPDNYSCEPLPAVPLFAARVGQPLPPEESRILHYTDASSLCCDVDWHGGDLGRRDILLEFANADRLAARVFFALAHFRPESAFLLRGGGAFGKTRFWSLGVEFAHVV